MKLHKDKVAFKELISATAAYLNFEEFQVEKDYYVSLLLQKLVEVSPSIVFKGGTSLSKCYDVINRFSEDIDITLKVDEKVSTKDRQEFKRSILKAIEDVGFELLNDKVTPSIETRSRRDFNKYLAGFEREFNGGEHMVDHIIVETNVTYRAFPCEHIEVSNYITKFLLINDERELVKNYQMEPFLMQVQTVDRTLLDKVFAVCDYYEENVYHRYSRHIYDIHMIWKSDLVHLEDLKKLIPDVIEVRKIGKYTHSCKTGYRVVDALKEIIEKDFYQSDFETNTKEFLSKEVSYTEAVQSLKEIMNSGLLPEVID